MTSSLITRPLSMGELLDVTFRIYRKHFWKLVLTAGGLLIPVQVLSSLLSLVEAKYYPGGGLGAFTEGAQPVPLWLSGPQFVLSLLSLFVVILTGAAVIWLANRILHNETPGVIESWRAGLKFFLRYIGMAAILGIVFVVGMMLMFMLLLFPAIGVLLFLIGMAFFFYVSVRFLLSPMALVVEDSGPVEALKTAWRFSSGHFWRIFFYDLLLWILGFVFYIVPVIIMESQFLTSGAMESLESLSIIFSVLGIVISFLNVLWTPLYLTALVVLYHDLSVRKQPGRDIEQRIADLEAAPQALDAAELASETPPMDAAAAVDENEEPAAASFEDSGGLIAEDDGELPDDEKP